MSAPFTLPPLPYPENALDPVISADTMSFHYNKHHKHYVDTLNKLVRGTDMESLSLVDIIRKTSSDLVKKPTGDVERSEIYSNAAQVWNHTFFWESMAPKGKGGGKPSGKVADLIDRDLGGFEKFKSDFAHAGVKQFGSGYAWLLVEKGKLFIQSSPNAVNPLSSPSVPLFAVDVWEHAYYLDYQNRRADFVTAVLDELINWDRVNERMVR